MRFHEELAAKIDGHNTAVAERLGTLSASARTRMTLLKGQFDEHRSFEREALNIRLKAIDDLENAMIERLLADAVEIDTLAETVRSGERLVPMPAAAPLTVAPVSDPIFESIVTSGKPDPDPAIVEMGARFAPDAPPPFPSPVAVAA